MAFTLADPPSASSRLQVLEAEKALYDLVAPDKAIKADAEERVRQAVDERAMAQARSLKAHFDAFAHRISQQADAERLRQMEELVAAKLQLAEAAGEAGNVDEAQRLMQEAEQLKSVAAVPTKAADPVRGAGARLPCAELPQLRCCLHVSVQSQIWRHQSTSTALCVSMALAGRLRH